MAKPELGSKHQCQNCGAKFFDLNKSPIVCPKCGTTFEVATAAPAARAPRASRRDEDENETENDGDAEVVSLEDADQTEDGKVEAAATDDDSAEDDDDNSNDDDNDAFLEDEDDDDGDVSGLIDGDIENDEER